ncbi:hypothetical protein J3Q64DRAFT_1706558 [Phycomyces blakesleeanus]|uniref:Uncharacterized protein n=1 Tax=Phycomyces blakesleeanus TaxID=4837 RepID=A0ABR3BBD5_PHYBL
MTDLSYTYSTKLNPLNCYISKIRVSNIFGFAMLMYRYSSPKRLFDMSLIFGMDPTSISAFSWWFFGCLYLPLVEYFE